MDQHEKRIRLEAIDLALEDLDRIITNMQTNNYPKDEVNKYVKQRWQLWNEQYKTRKL